MDTINPSGFSGPVRKASRWRPTSRLGWLVLILILVLIGALIWEGVEINERQAEARSATSVTKTETATRSTTTASSAVASAPAGTATSSVTRSTVTTQVIPAQAPAASAIQPPPAAAKAQASAPQTAKVEQKTAERKVAKTGTSTQRASGLSQQKAADAPKETAQSGEPFAWTHVGGDPCNPKVGCTLAWALERSKWPADVQSALMMKVRGESPETYTMRSGWNGWMTWGQYERKFRSNTLAAWPSGHTEEADLWSVNHASVNYNLVRVAKCKNWGGFTTSGPAPTRPGSPDYSFLGVIPQVGC